MKTKAVKNCLFCKGLFEEPMAIIESDIKYTEFLSKELERGAE